MPEHQQNEKKIRKINFSKAFVYLLIQLTVKSKNSDEYSQPDIRRITEYFGIKKMAPTTKPKNNKTNVKCNELLLCMYSISLMFFSSYAVIFLVLVSVYESFALSQHFTIFLASTYG